MAPWNVNDPKACVIHKRLGEVIAIDNQSIFIMKDPKFISFVKCLEPNPAESMSSAKDH